MNSIKNTFCNLFSTLRCLHFIPLCNCLIFEKKFYKKHCIFRLIIGSWAFHDDNGLTGENGPYGRNSYHLKVVHSICLGIESSLFGLFVVAVSCDQLQAIFNDETVVEAFQRRGFAYRRRRRRSKLFLLRQVCGPYHWSLWALPCKSIPSKRDFIHFAKDLRRSKV